MRPENYLLIFVSAAADNVIHTHGVVGAVSCCKEDAVRVLSHLASPLFPHRYAPLGLA